MGFYESCQFAQLLDEHTLVAKVQEADGDWRVSELDLDEIIGNKDGSFMWGGENFSQSAMDIELEGTWLTAKLIKADGKYGERQTIDLNDHIENLNGVLSYVH